MSASDSATLNFGNLTADSFALAYAQVSGPMPVATVSATAGTNPSATASAFTNGAAPPSCNGTGNFVCTTAATKVTSAPPSSLASNSAAAEAIGGGNAITNVAASTTLTTASSLATASITGPTSQSAVSYAQATKNLSVALATTTQSFARVSDTKIGGTIGGGFEWMMAPNWSFKAEALYYNLGSVTVSAPLTASINPLTAAIPPTLSSGNGPVSTASVTSAINKFTGAATVSNAAATHVNFQGVILRVGLNYHFNLM